MKRKTFFLIAFIFAIILSARSERVSSDNALKAAKAFLSPNDKESADLLSLAKTVNRKMLVPAGEFRNSTADEPLYYVFSKGSGKGYVVVAANDIAYPILGCADEGDFDENKPSVKYHLSNLAAQIEYGIDNKIPQSEEIKEQWDIYNAGSIKQFRVTDPDAITMFGPILPMAWDQNKPYNAACPVMDEYNNSRALTGEVALAMAEVMYYHSYPATFDWNKIRTNTDGTTAVLLYQCGLDINTEYSLSESKAELYVAGRALLDKFGYDDSINYKVKDYYEPEEWKNLLMTSIKNDGPVIYSSKDNGGARHTFVLDGYKGYQATSSTQTTDVLFHMVFTGNDKADYLLSAIHDSSNRWNKSQCALVGIKPPKYEAGQRVDEFALNPDKMAVSNSFAPIGGSLKVSFGLINYSYKNVTPSFRAKVCKDDNDVEQVTLDPQTETITLLADDYKSYHYASYEKYFTLPNYLIAGNKYKIKFEYSLDNSNWTVFRTYDSEIPYYQTITALPPVSNWTGSADSDWNNSANWANGAPAEGSSVLLTKNAAHYPVLTANTVQLSDVYFEPGAEIGRQDLLKYKRAFVQWDFNDNSTRSIWHSISIPLKEAKLADFSMGGLPVAYIDEFTSNGNQGVWLPQSSLAKSYTAGDGFLLWYAKEDKTNSTVLKGFNASAGVLELPFVGNYRVNENVHYTQVFTPEENSESTIGVQKVYGRTQDYVPTTTVSQENNRTNNTYLLENASVFNKSVNFGSSRYAMVGNPYMSSIDFDALYSDNSDVINANYRVWTTVNGISGYAAYPVGFGGVGTMAASEYIKPLTGFILEKKTGIAESQTIKFDLTKIGASSASPVSPARTSAATANTLNIDAVNSSATYRAIVAVRDNGSPTLSDVDTRSLFTDISAVPEIYTFKPTDTTLKDALLVNVLGSTKDSYLIPLGVRTNLNGEMSLKLSGMNTYDASIALIDATANCCEIDITGLPVYEHKFYYEPSVVNGTVVANDNRFVIRLTPKDISGIDHTADNILVYGLNNAIQVISTSEIKGVSVFSLQGKTIYANSLAGINETRIDGLTQGIYIVKIKTNNTVKTTKIIVK